MTDLGKFCPVVRVLRSAGTEINKTWHATCGQRTIYEAAGGPVAIREDDGETRGMLVIWGRHTSSNVQKLLWACTEMGVPFERKDMAGKFGFTDEYLAMNPNAVVPTIDDDGFVLWESNACLRYLVAKHDAGGLWPQDLQMRADGDRWMDWQSTTFWPSLRPAFHQLIRTPEDKRDHEAIRKAGHESTRVLKMLDDHLKDRDYIAGDRFTMGDIPMGVLGRRWFDLDIERPEERPHVAAWFERLKQRPAYQQHILIPME